MISRLLSFRKEIKIAGVILVILFLAGCGSLQPRWTMRTSSTPVSSLSVLASLEQESVALFTPLAPTPLLRGDEAVLGFYLAEGISENGTELEAYRPTANDRVN